MCHFHLIFLVPNLDQPFLQGCWGCPNGVPSTQPVHSQLLLLLTANGSQLLLLHRTPPGLNPAFLYLHLGSQWSVTNWSGGLKGHFQLRLILECNLCIKFQCWKDWNFAFWPVLLPLFSSRELSFNNHFHKKVLLEKPYHQFVYIRNDFRIL